jgi:hypothetical protein
LDSLFDHQVFYLVGSKGMPGQSCIASACELIHNADRQRQSTRRPSKPRSRTVMRRRPLQATAAQAATDRPPRWRATRLAPCSLHWRGACSSVKMLWVDGCRCVTFLPSACILCQITASDVRLGPAHNQVDLSSSCAVLPSPHGAGLVSRALVYAAIGCGRLRLLMSCTS